MYEVYALKYGERDTTACQFFYREASHAPRGSAGSGTM